MKPLINLEQANDISYSLRRYYVDEFHMKHAQSFEPGSRVLDLGGNRIGKRGLFDIEKFGLDITYANLSSAKKPDVVSDAAKLPFKPDTFDYVICSELLEHVMDPVSVIHEIHYGLKKRGIVLICVPFSVAIHGDPSDYGRYTNFFWEDILSSCGFGEILIENQGGFWSVLVDMIRHWTYSKTKSWGKERAMTLKVAGTTLGLIKRKAIKTDDRRDQPRQKDLVGYTTGFGVKACKL